MLSRVETSLVDPVGVLYEGNGRYYRAINADCESYVRDVLKSGLIEQLVSEGLFPATEISTQHIDGYALVLEHEKVGVPTYPFEWSPEMLRAAGLCVARVNSICNDFGYELKDAHPYNVIFDGLNPVFVDFGSVQPRPRRKRSDWIAASEFDCTFRYPLYFYAQGAHAFFQNAFLVPGKSYEHSDYLLFRFSILRLLPSRTFRFFTRVFQAYKQFACVDFDDVRRRWVPWKRAVLLLIQRVGVFPLRRQSSAALSKKLSKLRFSKPSMWAAYHEDGGFIDNPSRVTADERFQYVPGLIEKARPETVCELAGNQGVLAEHIAQLEFVKNVICCDYDEEAVDSLYVRCRGRVSNLDPLVLNFMLPRSTALTGSVQERIRGEMVIALAVTHHLTLSQGFGFDEIFRTIARYSHRYAIVDYMPLGLWDGTSAPPLPDWYSEDAFRNGLAPHFKILEKSQVQPNRIVYFLERTSGTNGD